MKPLVGRVFKACVQGNVPLAPRIVLLAMADLSPNAAGCRLFPKIATLVKLTTLSERTVQRVLRDLTNANVLHQDAPARGKRPAVYSMNLKGIETYSSMPSEIVEVARLEHIKQGNRARKAAQRERERRMSRVTCHAHQEKVTQPDIGGCHASDATPVDGHFANDSAAPLESDKRGEGRHSDTPKRPSGVSSVQSEQSTGSYRDTFSKNEKVSLQPPSTWGSARGRFPEQLPDPEIPDIASPDAAPEAESECCWRYAEMLIYNRESRDAVIREMLNFFRPRGALSDAEIITIAEAALVARR